jgi:hypothetical protein
VEGLETEVVLEVEKEEVHHLEVDDLVLAQETEILESHKCLVQLVLNVERLAKYHFGQQVTSQFTAHTVFQSIKRMVEITQDEMMEMKDETKDLVVQQIALQVELLHLIDLEVRR